MKRRLWKASPTKIITAGYLLIVLLGTGLLTLPVSSRSGRGAPFVDALFTATSATCVTGLVVYDTFTHWSFFGQLVLLLLIQVGGLGFMTMSILAVVLMRRKVSLRQRFIMQESVSAPQVGGIVRMTRFIFLGTLALEGVGALLLSFRFCPQYGLGEGIYRSVFTSVSAFCNAGFDLMGDYAPFSSLTSVATDPLICLVVMALIVIGGLGFYVWADVVENRLRFRRYKLHSKLVLVTTAALLLGGMGSYLLLEWNGPAFAGHSPLEKLLLAAFQSVTMRTAGFNTVDLAKMSDGSTIVSIVLMLIGGSPGSTAGGIKTTTFAVLFLSILTELKKKKSIECFGRRIEEEVLRHSCSIMTLYLTLMLGAAVAISALDAVPMKEALFETASAIGTVGLTLGITPSLSALSHLILAALMFLGRVGGLTILLVFSDLYDSVPSRLPLEKITVG